MAPERIHVAVADFDTEEATIRRIRFAVFVDEQKVPASLEMDDRDSRCIHVLASLDGEVVGTGRMDLAANGPDGRDVRSAKVGRVAVLANVRGRGVGTALMGSLHAMAERHGKREVWCNAQVAAAAFYERLGYCIVSARFEEAGIAHVRMVKELAPKP